MIVEQLTPIQLTKCELPRRLSLHFRCLVCRLRSNEITLTESTPNVDDEQADHDVQRGSSDCMIREESLTLLFSLLTRTSPPNITASVHPPGNGDGGRPIATAASSLPATVPRVWNDGCCDVDVADDVSSGLIDVIIICRPSWFLRNRTDDWTGQLRGSQASTASDY